MCLMAAYEPFDENGWNKTEDQEGEGRQAVSLDSHFPAYYLSGKPYFRYYLKIISKSQINNWTLSIWCTLAIPNDQRRLATCMCRMMGPQMKYGIGANRPCHWTQYHLAMVLRTVSHCRHISNIFHSVSKSTAENIHCIWNTINSRTFHKFSRMRCDGSFWKTFILNIF